MVQSGQTIEEARPRPPEPLADELRGVRFRYRGFNAEGVLEDWQTRWTASEALPAQVAIDIEAADGSWPALIVTLAQGSGSGTGESSGGMPTQ